METIPIRLDVEWSVRAQKARRGLDEIILSFSGEKPERHVKVSNILGVYHSKVISRTGSSEERVCLHLRSGYTLPLSLEENVIDVLKRIREAAPEQFGRLNVHQRHIAFKTGAEGKYTQRECVGIIPAANLFPS